MYDLNSLLPANSGWVVIDANAVNATQIVGYGNYNGNSTLGCRITDTDGDGLFSTGPLKIEALDPPPGYVESQRCPQ